MALIESFELQNVDGAGRRHKTSTHCRYRSFTVGGETILQLDTVGSRDRQDVGKPSQTIQLDRERAIELKALLERTFPGI